MKIVVATKNSHKVNELKEMLNMPEIEFFTMKDLNIDLDIEENGKTFEENATYTFNISKEKYEEIKETLNSIGKINIIKEIEVKDE